MRRLNLVEPVRTALLNSGVSTVKVVHAVNAALGELERKSSDDKLGAGSLNKLEYKVTNTITEKYKGAKTTPLIFDVWHGKVEACYKVANFDCIDLPPLFSEWLSKMTIETPPAPPAITEAEKAALLASLKA